MNNKLIASLSLLGLLFSIGCQRDSAPQPNNDGRLEFEVAISGVSTKASKTAFELGDKFGMWVVPYIKSDLVVPANDIKGPFRAYGNWFDNMLYTKGATAFTPSSLVYYPSPLTKVDLYAVTPYDVKMSDRDANSMSDPKAYDWAVKKDQSVAADVIASDLMTALYYKAYSGISPLPLIEFRHRLSKVNVNVTLPANFQTYKITALKSVEIINTKLKATVNITDTNTLNVPTKPVLVSTNNDFVDIAALKLSGPTAPSVAGDYKYEAIVIPQTVAANSQAIRITITCDVIGDVALYGYVGSSALEYVQCKQTAFNVTVEDRGSVVLGTPKIVDWGTTASVSVDARRAARLFFETTGAGAVTASAKIAQARLSIDDTTYLSSVKLQGTKLECAFMQPKDRMGAWLKSVSFLDINGFAVPAASFNPAFAVEGLRIKKDPTVFDYKEVISTATFN